MQSLIDNPFCFFYRCCHAHGILYRLGHHGDCYHPCCTLSQLELCDHKAPNPRIDDHHCIYPKGEIYHDFIYAAGRPDLVESTRRTRRDRLDTDRLDLVSNHVFHDALLAHLWKTEPLKRGLQTTPAKYGAKVQEGIDQNKVGEEAGVPIIHPPAGSDVYMLARLWQWWPILELEKTKPTGCTSLPWIGSTVSLSSRSTSTCRLFLVTRWF